MTHLERIERSIEQLVSRGAEPSRLQVHCSPGAYKALGITDYNFRDQFTVPVREVRHMIGDEMLIWEVKHENDGVSQPDTGP